MKNVVLGKSYTITSDVPTEYSYKSTEKGVKDCLTNGSHGDPTSCYGGGWAHFVRGIGRTITIPLSGSFGIWQFAVGFIQDKALGIYCPRQLTFSVSENGVDYGVVAEVTAPVPPDKEGTTRVSYQRAFNKPVKAAFIRIHFNCEVNVFCDEIEVYGDDIDGREVSAPIAPPRTDKGTYAPRECLGGPHDLVLTYYGYWPENERVALNPTEAYLPYVGYMDNDGKFTDTMFDAFMFLIVQGRCPSGGNLGSNGAPGLFSDWLYVLDSLFKRGYNLDALDKATEILKTELSLPSEHKTYVYLTAPCPKVSAEPFGDYDNDGVVEHLLSTEDCISAYARFLDMAQERWNKAGYKNLELKGYFWCNESLGRENRSDEVYFAKRCISELHARGLQCVFIPFYQAAGIELGDMLGFDAITMQPNLSFYKVLQDRPEEMMQEFTSICKQFGLGVELEAHHGAMNPAEAEHYGGIFEQYLKSCYGNKMMTETLHTYYQASGPGVFYAWAHSKNKYMRSLYDKLYRFIKGTYSPDDF